MEKKKEDERVSFGFGVGGVSPASDRGVGGFF
jgi:hypothetical protein